MYCLTSVMGLFMCTKANLRLVFFLCLWYESLGWCVVGRWNNSVDNICLSAGFDPTGVRPWLDAPPLSPYLRLRGPNHDRWPSFFFFFLLFFFLHHHGSRFQVGFLFLVQAECRLWAKEQYCAHRAEKKLHVASSPWSRARDIPFTSISKHVWMYPSVYMKAERNNYLEFVCLCQIK